MENKELLDLISTQQRIIALLEKKEKNYLEIIALCERKISLIESKLGMFSINTLN